MTWRACPVAGKRRLRRRLYTRGRGTVTHNQGRGQGERRPAAASREALFGLGELQKYGRFTLLSGLAGRGNLEISLGALAELPGLCSSRHRSRAALIRAIA